MTEQSTLAEDWDPRPDPDKLDAVDVYDPMSDQIHPPRMYYVVTTTGPQEWLAGHHVLASAGVAWRNPGNGFNIWTPDDRESLFIDSGGFQATVHYGGEYPYSPTDLFEWAEQVGADYVAGMDWACEEAEVLAEIYDHLDESDVQDIPTRIDRTIEKQVEQANVYESGDWPFEFVPVVQGLTTDDYRYCARRLREENVASDYMAIGSVCKRDSVDQIRTVLKACQDELPHTRFHLFGATRHVWKDPRFWGQFASGDTHAWAKNTPEGDFTQDKADKRRAFDHFSDDIEDTVERIREQDPMPSAQSSRNQMAELIYHGAGAVECVCGTEIPAYGDDFTPGCRHCERKVVNRWDRNMALVDGATHPSERHGDGPESTNLGDYP